MMMLNENNEWLTKQMFLFLFPYFYILIYIFNQLIFFCKLLNNCVLPEQSTDGKVMLQSESGRLQKQCKAEMSSGIEQVTVDGSDRSNPARSNGWWHLGVGSLLSSQINLRCVLVDWRLVLMCDNAPSLSFKMVIVVTLLWKRYHISSCCALPFVWEREREKKRD